MKTVEEAARVRPPAARPARLRREGNCVRDRVCACACVCLRLCVWAADWATGQARQADCACLLSFIKFPLMTVRSLGCGRKASRGGGLR